MIERRNFYRILYVQPDASMAVIRENYRILVQRLKMRPDLSDSNWNEELLDHAYDTLGDPVRRAVYDRELLKHYHIHTLSQGAFGSNSNPELNQHGYAYTTNWNEYNFYRVLQIQSDAPVTAIAVSYRALKKNASIDQALLEEAYRVLSNPETRQRYDVLLASHPVSATQEESPGKYGDSQHNEHLDVTPQSSIESYQAVISHYCRFCKTPYFPELNRYQTDRCLECASPLFTLLDDFAETSRRTLMRINIRGECEFYPFWPSKPYQGIFQDLSPAGVRFITEQSIDLHEIIKIDAPNFQAIGEVTHLQANDREISVGSRFIAVKFEHQRGNFIRAEA
ncbi:molecular chaperone DnaJ [Nitrosomonas sp. JL21]|uniref:J domain-containing protein n=1 Tax=Nitrosomonas sp. JL21 TaxID=153949 RepID=UPI00136AF00B|nr:DnaJ domain-containing protein [Nitrosomonas sp. JL21]MBL8497633.1 DnaJ domain-containing protein [Nitrosomonas sp.]MCC7092461.1 DnaJ domain-containing protein [Nitrosomonas sp.]MXS77771.1 molecular chaperone DnaJ [Nitrosomonas sp. JL21]